jgi:hypothetical protein
MGALDRLRQRFQHAMVADRGAVRRGAAGQDDEMMLRERLSRDPNDVEAFARLAEVVRRHAAEGHETPAGGIYAEHAPVDPDRAADDAVWALAEELAWSGRAWYPLIEMARLSIKDDREAALRRLGTAAERDPSGRALAAGLLMLREAGHPADALSLGVGHWRPREHDLEAGRQMVEAAVEAGRTGEARRHLEAMYEHPDTARVEELGPKLQRLIDTGSRPAVIDVRSERPSRLRAFLRR